MLEKILNLIYKGARDIRERLFRLILVMTLIVCVIAILAGLQLENPLLNALPILGLMLVVMIAILATFRFHKVDFAAMIFALIVVCGIFPFVFFASGGINGGATVWFVLGLLYIFIMFRGVKLYVFITLAVVSDFATYLYAYRHPELIISLGSQLNVYYDSLFAVVIVGIAVGVIMRYQISSYERERERTLKQKDEMEKMSKSKDAFFANMSHEIRTPINTIIGLNEMILREEISDEVAEDATKVQTASKMLLALINDILDFSQIESDHMSIVPVAYKTKEVFDEIVGLLQLRMSEKNLAFLVNIDSELPSELMGDEVRIKQILINLLTNAAKYTQKGSVTLDVRGELLDEGQRVRLTMSVTDTGIGIRKEDLESLYDYFKRVDREKNRKIEGSGLGLSITKQLVSLMGGTLTVDSIYRKGSIFTVTLEQPVVDGKPIGNVNYLRKIQGRDRQHYKQSFEAPLAKVLVVDDNDTNLLVITKLLRATKVQIDTAKSGEECLECLAKKSYHVVLLDSMMPGMNGEDTLKAIRRMESIGRQTPVIVVTANATAADKQRYLDLGFDGYLAKPIDGILLEAEVLKFLTEDLIEYRIDAEESSAATAKAVLRRKRKKIQITTDCVSDLPKSYIERYDIKMIYCYINTGDGTFRDTIEIDSDNLARYLSHPGNWALAVAAPVEEYENFYAETLAEAEEVIHISLAEGAGGGYKSAATAAEGFDHVHVIDAGHISGGQGLLVMMACQLLQEGCNQVDVLCREIEQRRKQIETTFLMPNIHSFSASGHGYKLLNYVFDLFNVHPVIQLHQSYIRVIGFKTGNIGRARKRYAKMILKKKNRIDKRVVFITHASCSIKQQQEFVEEILKIVPFENVILERGSVAGSSNSGLGTIGVAFLWKTEEKGHDRV